MISPREKEILLDEDRYIVRKFPAQTGAYVLKFVLEKALPAIKPISEFLGLNQQKAPVKSASQKKSQANETPEITMDEMVGAVLPILSSITREDLDTLMRECLNHCAKVLPAGPRNVMDKDGFGIQDLEYDTITCLILCYHVIWFNVQGFFGGRGLNLGPELKNLFQPKP